MLKKIAIQFHSEASLLARAFSGTVRSLPRDHPSLSRECLAAEMSVVRLYDAWYRFCRQVVLLSAAGKAVTLGGALLARSAILPFGATPLDYLRSINPGRPGWWEPRWADALNAMAAAKSLSCVNLGSITTALGSSHSPAEDLRVLRNYFAHRNRETKKMVSLRPFYISGTALRVTSYPGEIIPGGLTRLEGWVFQFRRIAEACIS